MKLLLQIFMFLYILLYIHIKIIEIAVAPIFLGLLILRIIRRKYTKKQNTEFLNRISEVASKAAVDAVKKNSSK
jgi:hypothetical protein